MEEPSTSENGLGCTKESGLGLTGNRILDRLPIGELQALLKQTETVSHPIEHQVYSQEGPMPHVYFPVEGVYSIILLSEDGQPTEAATIGCEGMLGVPVYLGLDVSPFTSTMQVPGSALQLPSAVFLNAVKTSGVLDRLMKRYTAYSLRYANQTILCNALHTVEERACRWLLMAHDRAGKDEFLLTHEYLAEMLGVRRQTVSLVAADLQRAGLITYQRGTVRVLNRAGLENTCCECHEVTTHYYARLMAD